MLRKIETHAALPEADRAAILALPYTERTVEPATYIVREGERARQCAVLVSGFAFRQKLTGDGARQILSIHIPGEALDFQNLMLDASDHNVQMLTRGRLAVIQREVLLELVEARPAIMRAIMINVLIEASIFREWILNVGRRDARARVAHVLCELAIRLEAQGLADEYRYELPMTQEQLGDVLGLTPVHVNRTLRALEGQGLIQRNKRQVSFPKWKELRAVGDFNSNYLHVSRQHVDVAT